MVVIGTLEVGGAEMDLVRNLPAIDRQKFEVLVYTFSAPGVLAPAMEAAGIPVHCQTPRKAGDVAERLRSEEASHPEDNGGEASATDKGSTTLRMLRKLSRRLPRQRIEPALRAFWKARHRYALAKEVAKVVTPMARFIRREHIDIIHCILPNAYFYGTIAALLAGRRNIIMSRLSLNYYQRTMPFYFTAERRFLHRFVRVAVGNAQSVLENLIEEGIPERKLFLLYNGIVVNNYAPSPQRRVQARTQLDLPPDILVITAVGNLHPYKGHADLIRAMALIDRDIPTPWRLLIAGSDRAGHEGVLRKLITELALQDRVLLLGHRDDVPEILAASDLHAMPSHEEGLPNSIIEAMASGLPIVASHVGGIPELVIDGVNGVLIEPQAPEKLARALLELVSDPDRRACMGKANIERVRENFSLEKSVSRYEELYGSLTRSP